MRLRLAISMCAGILFCAIAAPYAEAVTATPTPYATPVPPCSFSLCGTDAASGCKQDLDPGRSSLTLHDVTPDDGDRMVWKWLKGAATSKAEFGNPVTTTDYELCVYDGNGNLVSRACAPADGMCGSRPCWKERANGYKFRKRDLSPLRSSLQLKLNAGADGKGKILMKGKGPVFVMPDMPLDLPITVQLLNSNGVCWETEFFAPAQTNQPFDYKDNNEIP